jgi:hypothetical protein
MRFFFILHDLVEIKNKMWVFFKLFIIVLLILFIGAMVFRLVGNGFYQKIDNCFVGDNREESDVRIDDAVQETPKQEKEQEQDLQAGYETE